MINLQTQQRISETAVAIAGMGGIGAAVAMLCAKAGFGRLIICDHDKYEDVNIVEQMFANSDTVGKDKTTAAAAEIKHHNPECKISVINNNIQSELDATLFVEEADFVVSAVDNPLPRIWLCRAAENLSIPVLVPSNIGWTVLYSVKIPGQQTYEELWLELPGIVKNSGRIDLTDPHTLEIIRMDWNLWIALVSGYDDSYNLALLKGETSYYPYMAGPAFFAASFGMNQLVNMIAEDKPYFVSPEIFAFNTKQGSFIDIDHLLLERNKLITIFVNRGREEFLRHWEKYRPKLFST